MDFRRNLLFILKSGSVTKFVERVRVVHQKIVTFGLQSDPVLCKHLIELYVSFCSLEPARLLVVSGRGQADTSLWNALLAACSRNRLYKETLQIFSAFQVSAPYNVPDCYTFPSVLKACSSLRNVEQGRKIHARVLKSGSIADVFISSSLVGMYAKCGMFDSAIKVFDEMPMRDVPCWNTVISCYYQDGLVMEALEVFKRMRCYGLEPDSVTYAVVFSACAKLSALDIGRKIHEDLIKSRVELDVFISAALVDMYGKCGCLDSAREVFENIPVKCVVSWNSIIGGYASIGDARSCLELFLRMCAEGLRSTSTTMSSLLVACSRSSDLHHGKFVHGYILRNKIEVDDFIHSALIDLYFKCGYVAYAESVFKETSKINAVLWNVMISGYASVGIYSKSIEIFHSMIGFGLRPDTFSFVSVLSACSQLAALEQGREIHGYVLDYGLESSEMVMSAVLDMYAKCGAVKEARQIFEKLPVRDVMSWTSMIMAYGSHGQAVEALELFHNMQKSKEKPDHVTFLAVISTCAHAGLVDEGCYHFSRMVHEYGLEPRPDHYSCLIDLLGRAGRLQEACEILQRTTSMRSVVGLWQSLLSACSWHRNIELGEEVAKVLRRLDPDDHATYIVQANMYASVGRWVDARRVRAEMKGKDLKKNPGCSWIEVDKIFHQFYVADDSHPFSDMMYECIHSLVRHMEKEEKVADLDNGKMGKECSESDGTSFFALQEVASS